MNVSFTASESSLVEVSVQLNGLIERDVTFIVETLDSLTIENYMTEGKVITSLGVDLACRPGGTGCSNDRASYMQACTSCIMYSLWNGMGHRQYSNSRAFL